MTLFGCQTISYSNTYNLKQTAFNPKRKCMFDDNKVSSSNSFDIMIQGEILLMTSVTL